MNFKISYICLLLVTNSQANLNTNNGRKRQLWPNMISKYILIIVSILSAGCSFAPGSYPHVEEFKIHSTDANLVEAVKRFKMDNREYTVPDSIQLVDERKGHWYHVYFYYPAEDQIVYAWIRSTDNDQSTFALVSISQGTKLGNWKNINKDFDDDENVAQITKFEERILNRIKIYLTK
ncbi:MAG: hypothetical protein V4613_08055 [Bacteroidota bacterium]